MTRTLGHRPAAPPAAVPRTGRLPLTTLAIGFGLAGLAEAWTKAAPALRLPHVVPQAFWILAVIAWVWLLAAHVVRGKRSGQPLRDQLRHPAQGPMAALAPVTGMLLGGTLSGFSPAVGRSLFFLALAASALLAAWLFASWFEGRLDLAAMHPGYLLPTVAPGLVGADVAAALGYPGLGWALFGVGTFFAFVMTAIVVLRLVFHTPLPDALLPTTAILLAPPGVAGLAWFSLHGHTADPVAQAVVGVGVVLLLVQAAMLPRYRRLSFSLGFWSFTFPLAAAVALAEEWLEITEPAGWRVLTGVLLTAVTAFIAVIGLRSARLGRA
ncbi:transporter [Amycolatopsis sp. ATCC 39116]|uniref:SLAC1 family transporter n=1 Tax=Amycolatopsis sp. (strain ATCC 39116 / 75iv2) TaxID=385957 RepID=UPI0007C5231D|nr:transporter [Amycolatopsis sp. ATCC 39116]